MNEMEEEYIPYIHFQIYNYLLMNEMEEEYIP